MKCIFVISQTQLSRKMAEYISVFMLLVMMMQFLCLFMQWSCLVWCFGSDSPLRLLDRTLAVFASFSLTCLLISRIEERSQVCFYFKVLINISHALQCKLPQWAMPKCAIRPTSWKMREILFYQGVILLNNSTAKL